MSLAVIALTTAALATTGVVAAEEGMSYEEKMIQELAFDEIEYAYGTEINEDYSYYLGEDDYYIEFENGKDIDTFDYTMEYENKDEDMIYQYAINILARNSLSSEDVKVLENLRDAYDNGYILSDRVWDEALGIIDEYKEMHQTRGLITKKYNRYDTNVGYKWSGSKLLEIQYETYSAAREKNFVDTGKKDCAVYKASPSPSTRWVKESTDSCGKFFGKKQYPYKEQKHDGYNYYDTRVAQVRSIKEVGDIKPTLHGTKDLVNNVTSILGATSKYKTDVIVEPKSIETGSVYTKESIYYYENYEHIGTSNYQYRGTNNKGNTVIANAGGKLYGGGDFYQVDVNATAVVGNSYIPGNYRRSIEGSASTSITVEFKTVSRPFGMFDSSFREYYSCVSNDDFICNFTKLSVVPKLRSLPTTADGSISDEQKDVLISYLAPSYFTVDAMLLAVDAAEVAYWASVAASAVTGGASTAAAIAAKQLLMKELVDLGGDIFMDLIIETALEFAINEELSAYITNHYDEFKGLWKTNEAVNDIMSELLFKGDDNKSFDGLDLGKLSGSFDTIREYIRTAHQVGIYLDLIKISLYTDIDYADLFMLNVEIDNNYNNGFSEHIIA